MLFNLRPKYAIYIIVYNGSLLGLNLGLIVMLLGKAVGSSVRTKLNKHQLHSQQ